MDQEVAIGDIKFSIFHAPEMSGGMGGMHSPEVTIIRPALGSPGTRDHPDVAKLLTIILHRLEKEAGGTFDPDLDTPSGYLMLYPIRGSNELPDERAVGAICTKLNLDIKSSADVDRLFEIAEKAIVPLPETKEAFAKRYRMQQVAPYVDAAMAAVDKHAGAMDPEKHKALRKDMLNAMQEIFQKSAQR